MEEMEPREEYLMRLLGFETREQLAEWMSGPHPPTGNMIPPDQFYRDMQPLIEEEERIYRNPQ